MTAGARYVVGVPREIKTDEYRVAMIPVGVEELTRAGHRVLIQAGAGQGSGISDEQYAANGAEIVPEAASLWERADLVVKVKEPLPQEWPLLRPGQIVFTYFHFAADEPLTRAVMQSGITAVAYETIRDIQEGAKFLERPFEGRGILLGGVPGVLPANVVILGGGVVGANAAKVAAGLGANVTILDVSLDRLRYPDPRGEGPAAGAAGGPQAHAAAGSPYRRGHRPGRLRRDLAADDAQQPDVHGG
jgi:alanine dehydrogenase